MEIERVFREDLVKKAACHFPCGGVKRQASSRRLPEPSLKWEPTKQTL